MEVLSVNPPHEATFHPHVVLFVGRRRGKWLLIRERGIFTHVESLSMTMESN